MSRSADTSEPLHDLLASRWSPRAFAPRPVPRADLVACFEAARWAPSSYNDQPWHYVLAGRDEERAFAALLDCLVPGNQAWAGSAGALFVSVARESFARNGKPNAHAWHDVGQATAQLTLEARARGLYVHQMAGYDADKTRRVCSIPEGHAPVAFGAIGYLGSAEDLPANLAEAESAPRTRKPLDEMVFGVQFGQAHDIA